MNNTIGQAAIRLTDISKIYSLHHHKPTFFEQLANGFKNERFTALKEINLSIKKGEKVGIIGSNGSGKTTLLKIIAKITAPSHGTVETYGKLISLIELDSGFHQDLNGIENINLNGLLIGMTKQEIREKFEKIKEFADIGDFIQEPIFTYSQGMKLRLGFSVAIHSNPDILILDEGITAGDYLFQQKSKRAFNKLFQANKTIVVVSHQLEFIKSYSHRVIWINEGKIQEDGGIEVVDKYCKHTNR